MIIESTSNPKFKFAKSLQKSRNRKKEERFVLEGRPEIDLALKKRIPCDFIMYSTAYTTHELIKELLVDYGDDQPHVYELKKELFDELTYQHVPGNFFGVFKAYYAALSSLDASKNMLVLEGIEKPGNLGAILRTCDALGIEQIVCTESHIDLFNPNVLRNARGATFGVNICITSNEEIHQFLKDNKYRTLAAALDARATPYLNIDRSESSKALILGSESQGLGEFWLERADELVIIPMKGIADSLNVSVSAAILSSHLLCDQSAIS